MPAPRAPLADAIGSQLAAALAAYEADVASMQASWPDVEAYRRVSAAVDQIRLFCAALPAVRMQWLELQIAHAELIHCLWRIQHANRAAALEQLGTVVEHHGRCVAALRARCPAESAAAAGKATGRRQEPLPPGT